MSYRFGSEYIRTTVDSYNHRVISVSFDTSGEFVPCDEKIFLGGYPLSLAKRADGKYALMAIDDASSYPSEKGTVLFGTLFSLSRTGNGYAIPYSSSTPEYIDAETILAGMPIALGSNKELIVVAATGDSDEQADFFLGGMPIIARRIGNDWYLVMTNVDSAIAASSSSTSSRSSESSSSSVESSSSSSRRSSSSSSSSRSSSSSSKSSSSRSSSSSSSSISSYSVVDACFPSCQQTPTNSPAITGGAGADFCTDANGSYAENRSYADVGSYKEWIWQKTGLSGLPASTMSLMIRCDESTGEVAASLDYTDTDQDWGSNDSIWVGFKVVTGDVTCSGSNLTGTFTLDSLSWCAGSVTVVL